MYGAVDVEFLGDVIRSYLGRSGRRSSRVGVWETQVPY